ncbi:MAG: glycosyltransferase family 4 protein [Ruminococcaceae bacterium]|nr:glycosyltransferase family 4 protein [Oscillospiraceae bacterium]
MAHDAKRRRILVVSQHFWPENFRISDIVAGFVGDDIEVDVLCGLPNYPKGEWFDGYRYTGPRRQQYAGAQVFRAGEIRRKGNTGARIFLNYVSWPFFALFSLPRLAGRRYDAVFCYETSPVMMLFPAILHAKIHKLPLTCYVLDLWPDNLYSVLPVKSPFLRGIAQKVSDWHYRRCTRLIAMSDALAERLKAIAATAKHPPQVAVIPQYSEDFYGQDIPDDALKARFAGFFNLLFAGNISPAQNLENLVRAVKLVTARRPAAKLRVLLLGDGMSREALAQAIKAEGLDAHFEFCGQVPPEEIPRWTGMADALFAGLTQSENLGLTVPAKITSYLAAGRPLLVAMEGEGARVAQESGAALVSGAGDAEALAANIEALLDMPADQRAAMGTAGRAAWQAHYRRAPLLKALERFILEGQ